MTTKENEKDSGAELIGPAIPTSDGTEPRPNKRQEPYMPIGADLLPCPFCGGPAVLTNVRESNHTFIIGCYNELCVRPRTDGYGVKEDVIGLWNQRPDGLPTELEVLSEFKRIDSAEEDED